MAGLLDIFGGGDDSGFDEARRANERNRHLYDDLELPDYKEFVPEKYSNESADYKLTADDPVMRSIQLSQLNKMAGLADTGLSDADQADFTKAASNAGQFARSNTAAITNSAISRGQGGSGLEMLMREQAGQEGAQRAQDAGMNTAAAAAKQRALYNQAFGDQAAHMRDQDYRTNANNSNIINDFNRANTTARNATSAANTELNNGAFKYNEGLKDKTYNNEIGKRDRQAGFNNRDAEIGSAESAQNNARGDSLLNAGVGLGAAYLTGGASLPFTQRKRAY